MKLLISFCFFAFVFLSSCYKDIFDKTIDSDILISARYNGGKVYIDAETEKEFPCINYSIVNSIVIEEKKIAIDFIDVSMSGICATALGPARAVVNLGALEQGKYLIEFNLDGVKTEALLRVNSEVIIEITKAGNTKLY